MNEKTENAIELGLVLINEAKYEWKYKGFKITLLGTGPSKLEIMQAVANQMFIKLGAARIGLVQVTQDKTNIPTKVKSFAMNALKETQ